MEIGLLRIFAVFAAHFLFNQAIAAGTCQIYDMQPTALLSNETSCKIRSGQDTGCYDCCPLDWNCCDNGACMHYDPFCRYPSTCCKEKYCGNQCCSPSHGVPCGDLCAPTAYTCCNATTAQLCKLPDTCCGDHCCPNTHYCCTSDDVCCEKGTTCCPGKSGTQCCPEGTECCGDHCCEKGEGDVCQAGQPCCPHGRECGDGLCCPAGQFCPEDANTCCDNQWCDSTKRCCHSGSHCNPEGGCCRDGQTFCTHGSIDNCFDPPFTVCCSDGGACTPDYPLCRGNYCCPKAYPKICESQKLCHGDNGGDCSCCGGDECCYPPYRCNNGDCQYCHKEGWWWWSHTVCEYQRNSASHSDPLQRPHLLPRVKESGRHKRIVQKSANRVYAARKLQADQWFLSRVGSKRHLPVPLGPGPVIVKPASNTMKTGVILPPAPKQILSPMSYSCFRDQQAMKNTCKAFACMVQMTDCGPTGYLKSSISLYCDGIAQYRHLFTDAGKDFLVCLQNCVTSQHVGIFNQGIIPCCTSLETWGTGNMQLDCFKTCGFCKGSLFFQNAGAFDTLFNNDGSVNIYTIWYKACNIGNE